MASTSYTGRHRIATERISNSCLRVVLKKPGSSYPNPIGRVCYTDKGWRYSYVGGGSHDPIYGRNLRSARAAVKEVVKGYRSWMGETTLSGSRTRRRRR
jgi:hypothetical protein